jgi:hypothetical protein
MSREDQETTEKFIKKLEDFIQSLEKCQSLNDLIKLSDHHRELGPVLLEVNPNTADFWICPTSFVVGLEKGPIRTHITWLSTCRFVIQFIDRTPFASAQYHSVEIRPGLHARTVELPDRDNLMKPGIYEYAAAICTEKGAFVHVSGEMCMNPGGGDNN